MRTIGLNTYSCLLFAIRLVALARPLAFFLLFAGFGCNEASERPETVSKLRAIGAQINPVMPVASDPSDSAGTVIFYALSSAKDDPAFREPPLPQDLARFGTLVPRFVPDSNPFSVSDFGPLRLIKLSGRLSGISPTIFAASKRAIIKVPFATIIDQGAENEEILAETYAAATAADVVPWEELKVTVQSPGNSASVGSVDVSLAGMLDGIGGEPIKISWFVSSGEVENRRALRTNWTKIASGEQTAILTARGLKSKRFAYQIVTVEVQ